MDINKFTIKLQEALAEAQFLCFSTKSYRVYYSSFTKVLLEQNDSVVTSILSVCGVNIQSFIKAVNDLVDSVAVLAGKGNPKIAPSRELITTLYKMQEFANKNNDEFISSDIFLLASLEDKSLTGLYSEI